MSTRRHFVQIFLCDHCCAVGDGRRVLLIPELGISASAATPPRGPKPGDLDRRPHHPAAINAATAKGTTAGQMVRQALKPQGVPIEP